MPRPFRFQPPSLPEHVIIRPRLLEKLARRWDHRVVTVVAGPGFGKTVLLVAATNEPTRGDRRNVWLTCEPADESVEHLIAALAQALGLPSSAGIDAVLGDVWAHAPGEVCIVLDDVHEIPARSPGAALVARLATDLAANGHLLLASRDNVPLPLGRLAASGQLVRIGEADLVFDDTELASFARAHHVDSSLLAPSGGWPAVAALAASAGADLVPDYLWEEVLIRLGRERAHLLARFVAAGGGDDEIVSVLAGKSMSVDDVVASVPLVGRSADGWAVLHPLWEPAMRGVLTDAEAATARQRAAEVHVRNGRYSMAADLFVENEAWDGVLDIVRAAERHPAGPVLGSLAAPRSFRSVLPGDFGRWHRLLPADWRNEPAAVLASALELQARAPLEALRLFEAAAQGFGDLGDVDGELAAISHLGLIRSWLNDSAGLMALYGRASELAAAGSERARGLSAVGTASWAHVLGDSAGVLEALAQFDDDADPGWLSMARWLRSVAHRRSGDLRRAHDELDRVVDPIGLPDAQVEIARLRIEWLEGRVDHVLARLPEFHTAYETTGDWFLARELGLESAAKAAWLGDTTTARGLLDATVGMLPDMPNLLAGVLRAIASAAVAVAETDESSAGALLDAEANAGDAALGRPGAWYWRDRAAIALVYVLVPATRELWEEEPLGPAHVPGLVLAKALVGARQGDFDPVRALSWPDSGIVRAHLPLRWVVELAVAGTAARNPPPDDLMQAAGPGAAPALHALASASAGGSLVTVAKRLAKELPAVPDYRLRIGALGPIELWRDGVLISHPELRRQRVRELLCFLVARRRARREAVGDELWPQVADPAHNLRVNLNHLQQVLQPERAQHDRPYFLRTNGDWLELIVDEHLEIDVWELDARLDEADAAERSGAVTTALDAYDAALPLWRGEPFADAPYASWAEPERARLRARYVTAAVRAGELWLAARADAAARRAAGAAIAADPASEPAYQLLARAHVASGDRSQARTALQLCRSMLAELGAEPDAATSALLESL